MGEQPAGAIRYLKDTGHFYRCQELQRQVWGMSDAFVVHPPFTVAADGTMAVPTGPGIGVEVDEERLKAATVRKVVLDSESR